MDENEDDIEGVIEDTSTYVDVAVGVMQMVTGSGLYVEEADLRVNGVVWRVHKSDADPYPSKPHAHCIAGAKRFLGYTLHLGTAQLFEKRRPLDRYLSSDEFERLIALIQPKFPDISLPLPRD